MNLTCAAGILCGAESPRLPSPPLHKCMFCGDGMHGGVCGRLFEEIVKDRSFVGVLDCLNDRAKGLANSVGAIMCNLCIQTHLRQQDRTTSVTTNNDVATNDASIIPYEASIRRTSTNAAVTATAQTAPSDLSHLPPQFKVFLPTSEHEFEYGEDHFRKSLLAVVEPLGIKRLVCGNSGLETNKDSLTKDKFPRRRLVLICGSCKPKDRTKNCNFSIRMSLDDKKSDKKPFLRVKEFNFPSSSKHIRVSKEDLEKSAKNAPVINEDMLTPKKTKLLHALGTNRIAGKTAVDILSSVNGVTVDKKLAYRVMEKGRSEMFGSDDNESMVIFYGNGQEICKEDNELGVAGRFKTVTDRLGGSLVAWAQQYPVERLNADTYGKDATWVDTTHNASTFSFKTGLPSVSDWGGKTAPAGMFQVREEEINSCGEMLSFLGLDSPNATLATDGGSAWPEIARRHSQNQIEDTWHNSQNGDKKMNELSEDKKKRFGKLKKKMIYGVHSVNELNIIINELKELAGNTSSLLKWLDRMEKGRDTRLATYTTKLFSCSEKGATSRCEVSMSRLKGAGKDKAVMRLWSLPELQHRHEQIVNNYLHEARTEIAEAIKDEQVFSDYILAKEKEEATHLTKLRIVSESENAPNPFYGVAQTSQKTVNITIQCESFECMGVTLKYKSVGEESTSIDGGGGFEVVGMSSESPLQNSEVLVGMIIDEVNGRTFATEEEGMCLMEAIQGECTFRCNTMPALGTVYKIKVKDDEDNTAQTVFVPDLLKQNGTLHCQSDFYVHTSFLCRCRYIQRALMEHKDRDMWDNSTMHHRWHIKSSPLYKPVYDNLVAMMEIPGLGESSLPQFLNNAHSGPGTKAQASMNVGSGVDDDDSSDDEMTQVRAPGSQLLRYNTLNALGQSIFEIAKKDPTVYEMILPQLQHMHLNCTIVRSGKSSKMKSGQGSLARSNANLPIVPDKIRRSKMDDVNHAKRTNKKSSAQNGKNKRKKV